MVRLEIIDSSGKKITKGEYIKRNREFIRKDHFSRRELISEKLFTRDRLSTLVKEKQIEEVIFKKIPYYPKSQILSWLERRTKNSTSKQNLF